MARFEHFAPHPRYTPESLPHPIGPLMPRKVCAWSGCTCTERLTEVLADQGRFASALIEAETGRDDQFKMKTDAKGDVIKTYLCTEHWPEGLESADLLGNAVAFLSEQDQLYFGEVVEIAGWSRHTRHIAGRVQQLLRMPRDQWKYTVSWPFGSETMERSAVIQAARLAAGIARHDKEQASLAEAWRCADVHNALNRGQRRAIANSTAFSGATRIVAAGYGSLLSAMTPQMRRFMPHFSDFEARSHIISSFTTETPLGTIHHSGGGLIFDINKSNAASQTTFKTGFAWQDMSADYMRARPELTQSMFGFRSFDAMESFFECTWPDISTDEPGLTNPRYVTAYEEYMLALWRMRTRTDTRFMGGFVGMPNPDERMSEICKEWIPRLGQAGRSWVWTPSTGYLERSCPPSFKEHGMRKVAYVGDASDFLTQTVRAEISVRNQQHSDKSKHSAAMGVSWCTPSGWTAIASDLVLGRSSEYNTAVALAPQFAHLPHDWALCYDKGVASLRAHLPNLRWMLWCKRFEYRQCGIFTGMIPVYDIILIKKRVVWYAGIRKWYAKI